jgi:hypothetical protein
LTGKSLYCRLPTDWFSDLSLCWFEWQTLVSGLLAVTAAGFTVRYLKKQIAQSDKQERDRLRRQHDATRATLPLTLSGLIDAMRKMLSELKQAKVEIKQTSVVKNFDPPSPPTEAIQELQQIILSTDNLNVVQTISEIIRQMQTLWTRVDVFRNEKEQASRSGLSLEINERIIQAAKIHALIESLFDYARCETEDGPKSIAWERAESVLVQLYVYDEPLKAIVMRGLDKSPDFWQPS